LLARSQIHSITNRILDAKTNAYAELFSACTDLYNLLLHINDINSLDEKNRGHLSLDSGEALGLTWAAMCIKDIMRTKRFMDSVYAAVNDLLQVSPEKTIHVLYTGTGPFATLILPLTARFNPQQVRFSLIEVNEGSFHALQNLVSRLGLEEYIQRIENADATKWKLPADEEIDIFICETIRSGLKSEPQVAICLNIMPQLSSASIMIPQQITLTAALINEPERMLEKSEPDSGVQSIQILETIYRLNKETIMTQVALSHQAGKNDYYFPETNIPLLADVVKKHPVLYVLTDIIIYKEEKLLMEESPLSTPMKLMDLRPISPKEITVQYRIGNDPGIHHFSS
jgi:predicted RNA methylase